VHTDETFLRVHKALRPNPQATSLRSEGRTALFPLSLK
jgi:hypothetical protein